MSSSSPRFFHCAFSRQQISNSLKTALIVGTVLNLINQCDALFGGAALNLLQVVLTYLVPYCVSTYAGATGQMRAIAATAVSKK